MNALSTEVSLRFDTDFLNFNLTPKGKSLLFSELFEVIEFDRSQRLGFIDDIEDSSFEYSEIGNVTKDGRVIPVALNFASRDDLVEDYFKKIENGDLQKAQVGNILLSKVRPNLKKYVFVDESISDVLFTTAFIQLKPKKLNKILYYAFRTVFYPNLMSISREGKGYPTLKVDDLYCMKLDFETVNILEKNQITLLREIESRERQIRSLNLKIKDPEVIINQVISEEFEINIAAVEEEDRKKIYTVSSTLSLRNPKLRTSARWHKISPIQKVMYSKISCIRKLGDYIKSTKNGWSPNCRESDTDSMVFGVSCISKSGVITYDDLKTTDQTKSDIESYFTKGNDLFVSRGNTPELVALASVVENLPKNKNIIFPDLFIRVEINEKKLNKKYLAFLFNSIIGRLYFKYSAKGKNQTMVKISSDELNNFFLPVPALDVQDRIVEAIDSKLREQDKFKSQIKDIRNSIDKLIEYVIRERDINDNESNEKLNVQLLTELQVNRAN